MTQQKQIALYTPQTLERFNPEVLDVMKRTIAPDATDAEFTMFAHICAVSGLDPFKREIYFTKFGNRPTIMVAEDAYLNKAREMEGFQPPDTQVVCENDKFKARRIKGEHGDEWEILEHEITFPRGKIIAAYSTAYRDGKRPVTVFIDKQHIEHVYKGPNKDNWEKWELDMISKLAEKRALERQYGLNFVPQDYAPNSNPPAYEPPRRDVTGEVIEIEQKPEQPTQPDQSTSQESAEPQTSEEEKLAELKRELNEKFRELGIVGKEAKAAYIKEKAVVKGDTPTVAELTKLLKIIEADIAKKKAREAEEDDLGV